MRFLDSVFCLYTFFNFSIMLLVFEIFTFIFSFDRFITLITIVIQIVLYKVFSKARKDLDDVLFKCCLLRILMI